MNLAVFFIKVPQTFAFRTFILYICRWFKLMLKYMPLLHLYVDTALESETFYIEMALGGRLDA